MIRVVVVDDDPSIRVLMARELSGEAGVSVAGEAGSGAEAIEVLSRVDPDVVVLDYEMPGLDGLQTAAQILQRRPTQVVVLCSGALTVELRDAAEALGVRVCLAKTELDQLATTLRALVG